MEGSMGTKLLVIGYDGGTLDIIEPLVKKGLLPTFGTLIKNGAHGELQSGYPPVSAPAWASFMTGKNPGKHSVFNFTSKSYGTYIVKPAVSTTIDSVTLWELLSLEKKRVAVINVPITYPPKKINGIMVSGLGTPDEESNYIYPDTFVNEFKSAVPEYKIDVGWARYGNEHLDKFISDVTNLTQKTYEAAKYCLAKEEWDVFIVVFIGPDRIQHRLWNAIKSGLDNTDKTAEDQNLTKLIWDYFSHLDNLIGKLIDASGDNSNRIILSDHGFGPFLKDFDLNNWLACEGFLSYSSEESNSKGTLLNYTKRLLRSLGFSKEWILDNFGKKVDLYKYLEKTNPMINRIDWTNTKAFCYSSHFIYINLKGRERHGIVNPGLEYENLRDEIISKLNTLKDPETGRLVVKEVKRTEEVYNGHNVKLAPDLIITEYDEAGYIGAERLFKHERDDSIFMKTADYQEGVHRINGFFMANGRDIKKGLRIEGSTIMDLLPTILFMSNVSIPNDLDGKVLSKIIDGNIGIPHYQHMEYQSGETYNLTEEEKAKMIERLKSLGYL
jgi:predicted AlkP superfamily phosphohydrolase/phosphomutase